MAKKNMQSIVSALAPVAEELPTQKVQRSAATKSPTPADTEPQVQFSFSLRKSLRRDLKRLAEDEEMTTRAFILNALREKGLSVSDADILDLRKERAGG
ncbi:MAG: hypothetical protein AAGF25_00490 [Pseudomonadota bacterium]